MCHVLCFRSTDGKFCQVASAFALKQFKLSREGFRVGASGPLAHSVLCYAPRASPAACDSLPAFCLPRTVVSMRSTLSHPVSLAQVPQRLHHRRQGCFERLPGRPAAAERGMDASERLFGREVRGAIFYGARSTFGGRWRCSVAKAGFKPRSWRLPTSPQSYTQVWLTAFVCSL